MIERNVLEKLCNEYGIDGNKIINKNYNILAYGNYSDIKMILDYLIKELNINPKSIEKCPSIISFNVYAVLENCEFLKRTDFNFEYLKNSLHVLNTNPRELKKTYNYLIKKYGEQYFKTLTSILTVTTDRIKEMEKAFPNLEKEIILIVSLSKLSIKEIEEIISLCKENNLEITSTLFHKNSNEIKEIIKICNEFNITKTASVFKKKPNELREIIDFCIENNINLNSGLFLKKTEEIKEIIEICKKNNIKITSSIFMRKPYEIEEIINICNLFNIEIINGMFIKQPKEIKQIIEFCNKNNIEITGGVFKKQAYEIEEIIKICKDNNIEITGSVFKKQPFELREIIKVCEENNIKIKGSIFLRQANEIKEIIDICKENNIEIYNTIFKNNPKEIKKIIELCKKYNIEIKFTLFLKSYNQIKENITFIENTYGKEYLTSIILSKNIDYLKKTMSYLNELGLLPYIIKSPNILTLTLEELEERKEYLESIGEEIIIEDKFNPIFGLSKKNYLKRKERINKK